MDGVSWQLRAPHDFAWLEALGKVFAVFDQQDSGNLSFGVATPSGKKFIKYAGAPTLAYSGDVQAAVARLQQAVRVYEDLQHPALIKLCGHGPAGQGYAALFEWNEGENLHPHWSFPPPAKYEHPDSPYYRYKQLPIMQRVCSVNEIFDFHEHVERQGYVAVDFYDGSILYDFNSNKTVVCDIDLYHKGAFVNRMGRLWGSSRFMAPEEFRLDATIDGITNVFVMGAVAFGLLGGECDRSLEKWEAGEELYKVAAKAVQTHRQDRYASVAELNRAWRQAQKGLHS
ncbi:serine/threonine protein kinase [Paenibacillus sp. J22TS3]|uniref:serine/threonine protein kinase n=1 Tax=Paenibacillus sp. J22TS3 TaxID=2807192 RepID=UPI001BCF92A5|nr:serine/threonine protein kinase [Paenibacillus sp. J22TS3]